MEFYESKRWPKKYILAFQRICDETNAVIKNCFRLKEKLKACIGLHQTPEISIKLVFILQVMDGSDINNGMNDRRRRDNL